MAPELGQDFLQPFKSQGVLGIDDVGIVIRGQFIGKPGRQFVIRKEVFNCVCKAFEEAGIDPARRVVRVAIPGLEQRSEPHKKTRLRSPTQLPEPPKCRLSSPVSDGPIDWLRGYPMRDQKTDSWIWTLRRFAAALERRLSVSGAMHALTVLE